MKQNEIKEAIEIVKDVIELCKDNNTPEWKEREKAYELAIQALEKQLENRPIGKYTNYKCPMCCRRVRSGKGSSSFSRDNFCQRCGQKLDWSGSDE